MATYDYTDKSMLESEILSHSGLSYDDYHEYYYVKDTVAGDYTGSLVEIANRQVFEEMQLSFLETLYWHYSTKAVGFAKVALEQASIEELIQFIEALDSLESYPSLDDQLLSNLEFEAFQEAWSDYIESDFRKELAKQLGNTWQVQDLIDSMSEEQIVSIFDAAKEASNTYYINEVGSSMYIDVERIAKEAVLQLTSSITGRKLLKKLAKKLA